MNEKRKKIELFLWATAAIACIFFGIYTWTTDKQQKPEQNVEAEENKEKEKEEPDTGEITPEIPEEPEEPLTDEDAVNESSATDEEIKETKASQTEEPKTVEDMPSGVPGTQQQ